MANAAEDGAGDTWEDLEDSGELDRRIKNIKPSTPVTILVNPSRITEEGQSHRPQMQPSVKILRRQPGESSNLSRNPVQTHPKKSLEQRQAEYAEARMRIFGTTDSVADKDASDVSPENVASDTIYSNSSDHHSSRNERPARLVQQLNELKVNDVIARQPKGPDGSRGFQSSR